MIRQGLLTNIDHKTACKNFVKAAVKGVVKVISKMGISTIQSYRGAQIFEAIGLKQVGHRQIFHLDAFAHRRRRPGRDRAGSADPPSTRLPGSAGQRPHARCRRPISMARGRRSIICSTRKPSTSCSSACRTGNYKIFKEYSALVNDQIEKHCTLRGLLDFKLRRTPIPIEEVESVEAIVKRFKTGAMSYGSISKEAHEALAIAMNRIGGKSNTGEGGEDPERYMPDANGDSQEQRDQAGRFGPIRRHEPLSGQRARNCRSRWRRARSPAKAASCPAEKFIRGSPRCVIPRRASDLISPPPHHDIYSIEDLAELIHDLKNANHHARISVKLVAEVGVGTIAAGVAKAHADVVLISGYDGGTGASPQTSIKHAGIPWELGLAETHQTLVLNNLRSRIVVETDGQLKTGRDVVVAALLGAEEFGFATAPLVALGCIMMRVCHLNTCPVGVATQDPELRKKFTGDPAHAVNFMRFIAQEVREIMAQLGFRTIERNDRPHRSARSRRRPSSIGRRKGLDFTQNPLSTRSRPTSVGRFCQIAAGPRLGQGARQHRAAQALRAGASSASEKVVADLPIRNVNRVVGTIVGSEVTRRYGAEGLPEDTIQIQFQRLAPARASARSCRRA